MARQMSFEDAAFELFQALFPDKKLSRDEVPYETLREMVERHLNNLEPEKKQRLLARLKGEVSSQGSSGSKTELEDAVPSPSKPKTASECRSLLLVERHHLLPRLEDFNDAQKIHLKYPKNVRKFVRMRTERRLMAESNEYVNIVCEEENLPQVFQPIYDQILKKHKSSLQCYHAIINTLHHYFMRKTWSELVSEVMDDYITKHILLTCDALTQKYDREEKSDDIFERLREYELMVLLGLHVIKNNPEKIEETEVVNLLGFLVFVADSVHMKTFLDEIVCDQFAHIIPKALIYVYEELCMKLPADLEDTSAELSGIRIPEVPEAERRSSRKSGQGSAALLELVRKESKKESKGRKSGKTKSERSSPESETGKPKTTFREQVKKAERISKRIAAREKGKAVGAHLRH